MFERVVKLEGELAELAKSSGGYAKAVRTDRGRALYSELEMEKKLARLDPYVAAQKRAEAQPSSSVTKSADALQAEFDALVKKHATAHGVDTRTARLAVVKTPEGRSLYGAIDLAKRSGR